MGASQRRPGVLYPVKFRDLPFEDQQFLSDIMAKENPEPPKGGYDPNTKRMTCPTHGLTWHKYGGISETWKCTEC